MAKRYIVELTEGERGQVKRQLWSGGFWGKGYFMTTAGQHGKEKRSATYIRKPGTETSYK